MTGSNRFAERLTSENAVFASIDHQTGLLVGCRDIDPTVLKSNILGLAHLARILDLPTVVTSSVATGPNGPVMPEISDTLPDARFIGRDGEINAWDSPEFKRAIEETGRKKIIMAGIVTDVCLMFPAISAVAEGYDVYAVIDASGTWDAAIRDAAVHRMSQAGVKVATWASVLAEIMGDWRSPKGRELGELMSSRLTSYGWVVDGFTAHGAS
ncbi:Isochorismatase family protein [Sulfidibacter corallicola]|uniref:Isochorismatase family protein n=1 Tax=Sulfidibacter corallicola TaxID=2818388 RepID=A0A8A4TGL7_SULCO|nr:isochorismatase family protein [Sulfidibacter corallicola]QTD49066.1 isochorismatase family protein [Sulfidibacter corallicola]